VTFDLVTMCHGRGIGYKKLLTLLDTLPCYINCRNIGAHRKYKRLKFDDGQAYSRSQIRI